MSFIPVTYQLVVGKTKFRKKLSVLRIPHTGTELKIENNLFIVSEDSQDLDAYGHEQFTDGESVIAKINPVYHQEEQYQHICDELISGGWKVMH